MNARELVNAQAEDEGLWFVAETEPEVYLQQELRKLHAAVESSPWASVPDGLPEKDGYYLLRIQQIGGDDFFYSGAERKAGVWDTLISEANWTHWQPIEAPE